jgi:hypothetical protein
MRHRIRETQRKIIDSSGRSMSLVKSLVDPKFADDDVTILLLKRDEASSGKLAWKAPDGATNHGQLAATPSRLEKR